jgi:hypothetical protein
LESCATAWTGTFPDAAVEARSVEVNVPWLSVVPLAGENCTPGDVVESDTVAPGRGERIMEDERTLSRVITTVIVIVSPAWIVEGLALTDTCAFAAARTVPGRSATRIQRTGTSKCHRAREWQAGRHMFLPSVFLFILRSGRYQIVAGSCVPDFDRIPALHKLTS